MELLNYETMTNRFESKETKQKITIYLFSKDKDSYTIHSEKKLTELIQVLEKNKANGEVGECFLDGMNILASIGTINKDDIVRRTNIKKAMRGVYSILQRFDQSEIEFEENEYVEDAIHGLIITSFKYDFLKKEKSTCKFFLNAPKYSKIIKISHAQNFARFLGETPANWMTPTLFTEYAKKFFENENVEIKVFDKKFMEEKNMNLILSVSQGSAQEPKLLHIRYIGADKEKIDVALVGKGVCFDTGGISLKPGAEMCRMKHDMLGAATLMAALKVAVDQKLKINITATFPLVENMPGSKATKPGDVFIGMSGKSVEVDNTDAEGRLILSDALTFAQLDKPTYLIDAATLTGAMHVALGNVYGGYFANDDDFAKLIYDSGLKSNDPLWRMPLSTYYRQALKSNVADLNNMGGPGGGSIKAAEFLNEFVEENVKWAHFDIAGISDKSHITELYGKDVTGRPVPAFVEILERLEKISL